MAENKRQLKQALADKNITVSQFSDIINGDLNMSYQTVARYCRQTERTQLDFLSEYRWKLIDIRLEQLGVDW